MSETVLTFLIIISYLIVAAITMVIAFWQDGDEEEFNGYHFMTGMVWPIALLFVVANYLVNMLEAAKRRRHLLHVAVEAVEETQGKVPVGPGRWRE